MIVMTDMKCPNCGCTDFENYSIGHSECVEGRFISSVDAFVCANCGRVELYAKQDILNQKRAQSQKQKEVDDECARIDAQIAAKKKELAELNSIVNDENQTVKAVKEAKERLIQVQNEINSLENQRANVRMNNGVFRIF